MNRVLYSLMLLLGTVAGCSKSSVGYGDEDWTMNFVCSSLDSRATENITVSDLSTNGINLVGYASIQSDIYVVESPLINTSGSVWEIDGSTSNATSEWPESGTVDFFAYSPSSDKNISSTNTPLSMSHSVSSTIANQVDLMVASAIDCSSSGGAVALEFNHALSCISFAVYSTSSSEVSVSSIGVTVANNNGILSVARNGEITWGDLSGNSTTYSVPISTETISTSGLTVVNTDTGYLKLIPQILSSGDKIEMKLTVNGVESSLSLDLKDEVWSVGEKYTYTVSVSDKEITFGDVVVSNWTDQEEANLSESDGIVNLNIYNTADLLESIVTDFTLFNIKNVSVIGGVFEEEGAIALMSDSDYATTYMSGNSMSFPSNSPYISILSNIGRLDLSSVTGLSGYTVPMFAFSPGLKFSGSDMIAYSTSSLHTVLLPDGVTGVGQMCFAFSALEEAYYDNLPSLGDYGAFYGCESLRTVSLAKVTSIPSGAFYGCTSLSRLLLPSMTAVESGAFQGCTSLAGFDFPDVTTIGSSAFQGCTLFTEFSNSNITAIESSTFKGCTSLVTLDFPNVTSVGEYAFQGCTSLTEFIIPYEAGSSITVDYLAFYASGVTHLELLADTLSLSLEIWLSDDDDDYGYDYKSVNLFVKSGQEDFYNYSNLASLSAVDIDSGVVTTTYNDGSQVTDAYEYDSATGTVKAKE